MILENYLNRIIIGDCTEVLSELSSGSINLIVTSPPYFQQRKYTAGDESEIGGEESVEEYLGRLVAVFRECYRILRADGSIVFNLGDKYLGGSLLLLPYRFAVLAMEQTGAKLINNVAWIKTNPTPRQFQRRLVSSHEPFLHFVKHKDYQYDLSSCEEWRPRTPKSEYFGNSYLKQTDASALSEQEKEDARQELTKVVEEVKAGNLWDFRMKLRGVHALPFGGISGGRNAEIVRRGFSIIRNHGKVLQRDVIECATETLRGNKHPAVFPEALVRKFISLTTRPGDVVLDPFVGSGTTAVVCRKLGRHYVGVELSEDFALQAQERIDSCLGPLEEVPLLAG